MLAWGGCCSRCAKSEGESCAGDWNFGGTCAQGLSCFKHCGNRRCMKLTSDNKECIFPFKYVQIPVSYRIHSIKPKLLFKQKIRYTVV